MFLITHNPISISAQRQYSSPKLPGHTTQSEKLPRTFIAFAPFLLIHHLLGQWDNLITCPSIFFCTQLLLNMLPLPLSFKTSTTKNLSPALLASPVM